MQKGPGVFKQTPHLSSAGIAGEVLHQGRLITLDGAPAVCAEPPRLVWGLGKVGKARPGP